MTDAEAAEHELKQKIEAIRSDLAALLVLWHERRNAAIGWVGTPSTHVQLARAFIEVGAPLLGLEVAVEGLESFPRHVGLRQVRGLALARSGSTEEANTELEALRAEGSLDDQTLGVLARTHKDLALAAPAGDSRCAHLAAALRHYADAYASSRSYWTGVNVATLAALSGDPEQSIAVAREVMANCRSTLTRLPAADPDRYWVLATLGEAALCLGDLPQAADWYGQAAQHGRHRFGDLNSTRRHARLLLEQHGRDVAFVDAWLPLPKVVIFSGHMMDRVDRPRPRFPETLEATVSKAIRDWLSACNGLIGFSSAACGADLLFLEAVNSLGGETHVVLPCHQDEFVTDSVDIGATGEWRRRFDAQLACSRVVYASSSRPLDGGLGYDYANHIIHGLGQLRAKELETGLAALTVWDGQPGDGRGGTSSAVRHWQRHGIPVHQVRLDGSGHAGPHGLAAVPLEAPAEVQVAALPAGEIDDAVMALLFADAVGFSQLNDAEVPLFVDSCLGLVAQLIDTDPVSIPVRETWGDGLFLAFTSVRAAGVFALALRDAMVSTDWTARGFVRPLTMRFALHAGPVHLTTDPITGLPKCCGTHVSRAARLEPKTPSGQVYASEAFAALAAVDNVTEFRCDYVKQLDWAKRYGTFPAYVVRRPPAA